MLHPAPMGTAQSWEETSFPPWAHPGYPRLGLDVSLACGRQIPAVGRDCDQAPPLPEAHEP